MAGGAKGKEYQLKRWSHVTAFIVGFSCLCFLVHMERLRSVQSKKHVSPCAILNK